MNDDSSDTSPSVRGRSRRVAVCLSRGLETPPRLCRHRSHRSRPESRALWSSTLTPVDLGKSQTWRHWDTGRRRGPNGSTKILQETRRLPLWSTALGAQLPQRPGRTGTVPERGVFASTIPRLYRVFTFYSSAPRHSENYVYVFRGDRLHPLPPTSLPIPLPSPGGFYSFTPLGRTSVPEYE